MRRLTLCFLLSLLPLSAQANDLDVPITENPYRDCQAAWYSIGQVQGLKADGDGFLSVRSGPGSNYRKLDEVYNGDKLEIYEVRGDWLGVVYRGNGEDFGCSTTPRPLPYTYKGWVHRNWVKVLDIG
ncbi:SH3 domain-containing protein [Pseudooceanicola sp.]|uniref:SH3 domain-containing protein n=1 Tax=Pseudooceanicola sp. TaxID=1914328 RepID=UPI0035C73FF5